MHQADLALSDFHTGNISADKSYIQLVHSCVNALCFLFLVCLKSDVLLRSSARARSRTIPFGEHVLSAVTSVWVQIMSITLSFCVHLQSFEQHTPCSSVFVPIALKISDRQSFYFSCFAKLRRRCRTPKWPLLCSVSSGNPIYPRSTPSLETYHNVITGKDVACTCRTG